MVEWMGRKFWCFPWFPENSLLCVILRYTVYVFLGEKIYLYMSLSFKCEARSWALLSLKSPHMLLKAYIITNKALFWIQYKLSCTLPLHRAGSIYRHTILWLLDRYISWVVYRVCILVFMYFCVQIHMELLFQYQYYTIQ